MQVSMNPNISNNYSKKQNFTSLSSKQIADYTKSLQDVTRLEADLAARKINLDVHDITALTKLSKDLEGKGEKFVAFVLNDILGL